MPVIIVSSLAQSSCATVVEALRLGAADVVAKPSGPYSVGELMGTLAGKVRAAAASTAVKAGPEAASSNCRHAAHPGGFFAGLR